MDYKIDKLTSNNLSDVSLLYKKVLNKKIDLALLERKYNTAYLSKSFFGHIAYYRSDPVAFYGAIPILMKHDGKIELSAQYCDAMTYKNHEGKGLFSEIGILTDELLKQNGVKFVWGFPNQNSEYACLNKLNWNYEERLIGLNVKLSNSIIGKSMQKNNFTNHLFKNRFKKTFEKYEMKDYVFQGLVLNNPGIVSTYRNKAYFSYKSFSDSFVVDLEETKFWIKNQGSNLLLGDMEYQSLDAFYKGFSFLKTLCRKANINQIIFQVSPGSSVIDLLLTENTRSFPSWIVGYKNFNSEFPLKKLKLTYSDLDTF